MSYRFRDLYFDACNDAGNVTPLALEKARGWARDSISEINNKRPWYFLRKEAQLTLEANGYLYGLPNHIGEIEELSIRDRNTPLLLRNPEDITKVDSDKSSSGDPTKYCIHGVGMFNQPSSVLMLTSTEAADTGTGTVYGYFRGRLIEDKFTLNGTTPVATTGGCKFSRIEKAELDNAQTGIVSSTSNSTSVTNFSIAIGDTLVDGSDIIHPSAKVNLISNSEDDDSTFTAYMTFYDPQYDIVITESVQMSGTAVTAGFSSRTREILGISVYNASHNGVNGTVRLLTDASELIAIIEPGDFAAQYMQMGVHPYPTSALTVFIAYKYAFKKLTDDSDILIPIPDDFFHVYKARVTMKAYRSFGLPQQENSVRLEYLEGLRGMEKIDNDMWGAIYRDGDPAFDQELGWPGAVSV